MIDCLNLTHPFQTDPGVSQEERAISYLLSDIVKIDDRKLADLLIYFRQFSRHVIYYNKELNTGDWQNFFDKSIPFTIAGIIEYDIEIHKEKLTFYSSLFKNFPSPSGLQLNIHYFYYQTFFLVNKWYLLLKDSSLPLKTRLEFIIKNQLVEPLREFIELVNTSSRLFNVIRPDFQTLLTSDVWGISSDNLQKRYPISDSGFDDQCDRIVFLFERIREVVPAVFEGIRGIQTEAGRNLEFSIYPWLDKFKTLLSGLVREENDTTFEHSPHLGLLFSFIHIFRQLIEDLNKYSKKHLDFFYKSVLQLTPGKETPDKVHVIFEIQKHLKQYLLKKGIELKDSKDKNKAEVLFSLDDDIVINKAVVADTRTLFLNNYKYKSNDFTEGVYIAPNAQMADGVGKEFKSKDESWPTLGDKKSKYIDPELRDYKPYPNARLGFILASPVLLLNEGNRSIKIKIKCKLSENICDELFPVKPATSNPCCDDDVKSGSKSKTDNSSKPLFRSARDFYSTANSLFNKDFFYISRDIINSLIEKGANKEVIEKLKDKLKEETKQCYCPTDVLFFDTFVDTSDFSNSDKDLIARFIKPQKLINIQLSGEESWIRPKIDEIKFEPANISATNEFDFHIDAHLKADMPPVTFYDGEKLGEDLSTELPLVKIELNDSIKLDRRTLNLDDGDGNDCCLNKNEESEMYVSFYHFFRNISILNEATIDVSVCGVKNLIVQNDSSVQDVNGPIFPFGTRPNIIDFTVVDSSKIYCITQQFIVDAENAGISNAGKNKLLSLLGAESSYRIISEHDRFLKANFSLPDVALIHAIFNANPKKYCKPNLQGPSFYIGSKEIFCKKWNTARLNLNWENRPSDFTDYYKAYRLKEGSGGNKEYGLDINDFKIRISQLIEGDWQDESTDRKLFDKMPPEDFFSFVDPSIKICDKKNPCEQSIKIDASAFPINKFQINKSDFQPLTVNSRHGFIKINLRNQDFLHKDYSFVLARQMMALGKYPDSILEGAVYEKDGHTLMRFKGLTDLFNELITKLDTAHTDSITANTSASALDVHYNNNVPGQKTDILDIFNAIRVALSALIGGSFHFYPTNIVENFLGFINTNSNDVANALASVFGAKDYFESIKDTFGLLDSNNKFIENLSVVIPNEPWTPVINKLSIDYTATAEISDIDLIHLYPYKNTHKAEDIEAQPTLLPTHCNEGTLFLGLKELVPGNNVNILFQIAEATADSESEKAKVNWHYLENNVWRPLRKGFEIIDDVTNNLTSSGIIKIAMPENISNNNTLMPKGIYWIKASVFENSRAVGETFGIHTQAAIATFTNQPQNDKLRLAEPLAKESVAKLKVADASVTKVVQPYDSFGGRIPESSGPYYTRVSELLRHKNRSIQKWDYERICLEYFPLIYRAKCINHSFVMDANLYFNDFPVAPGYVILAVIPDIDKLKANYKIDPKVSSSLLGKIEKHLSEKTSPFVRLRVMNPRYEKVNVCTRLVLKRGKDENYYKEQVVKELKEFISPWLTGDISGLYFGNEVYHSDILQFLETRDYIEFISEIKIAHESKDVSRSDAEKVTPLTPRSILIAGSMDVCILPEECDSWLLDEKQQPINPCKEGE